MCVSLMSHPSLFCLKVSDVVWVKLDEGDVTFNLTDSICPALPESASKRFLINYKKLQEEHKRIDILMTEIPSILDEDAAERKEELEADYDSCLSSAFLDLIVESVGEMFIFQTRNVSGLVMVIRMCSSKLPLLFRVTKISKIGQAFLKLQKRNNTFILRYWLATFNHQIQ